MNGRLISIACAALLLAGCGAEEANPGSTTLAQALMPLGFVVTDFTFEQPPGAPACPRGFNQNEREFYLAGLSPAQRAAEADLPEGFDYLRMLRARGGPDPCSEPTSFDDPDHLLLDGPGVAAGFDLDGVASTRENPGGGVCPHDDFSSAAGEAGIDNQLWRVLGCIDGYQPGGEIDSYAIENIKDGGRTILIEITDLDDARDDGDVGVGIYSSPDTIPASAQGNPLPSGSLSVAAEPRYRSVTRGSVVGGVLTAGPIDLRLDFNGQFLDSELHLREAKVRLELTPDGGLQGLLGGYWDVEEFYDAYARQATRSGAFTVGFRCPALYAALKRSADRYPDPESGACSAMSTAFRIKAIPAFVVGHRPPSADLAHAGAPSRAE